MTKAPAALLVLLAWASMAWADDFNGRLRGTIEGHVIDVAVQCERMGGWLQARSDPSLHGGIEDRDGDGIVATVSGSEELPQAVFTIKIGDALYRFNGTRDIQFSDAGLAMQSTLHRYEGRGADRKIVSSYDVDLTLECSR